MCPKLRQASLMLVLLSSVRFTHAQWNANPNTTGHVVCQANGLQLKPWLVPDFSGGIIAVWEDSRTATTDIYYERMDDQAQRSWAPGQGLGVKLCSTSKQRNINRVISDGTGGMYLVWDELNNGFFDLYAQYINGNGQPQWGANGLTICNAPNDQYNADLAVDINGNLVVTWTDTRNDVNNSKGWQTFAQKITPAGQTLWTANGLRIGNTTNRPIGIVSDDEGGTIVACLDARNSLLNGNNEYQNLDVYAYRINANGQAVWNSAGVAVCTQTSNQLSEINRMGQSIVPDGAGGAILSWTDYRTDPNNGLNPPYRADLYAQRLNNTGAIQWVSNGIAVCAATNGDLYKTAIVADGAGGIVAAWFDLRNNPDGAIYYQRINESGNALYTANGRIAVANQSHEIGFDITEDGSGNMAIVYDTDADQLFMHTFTISNGLSSQSPIGVCTQAGASVQPTITTDASGAVYMAWEDYRNGATASDIFAFKYDGIAVLPINLLQFAANWQGQHARLSWTLQTDEPTTSLQVQKSTDGRTFHALKAPTARLLSGTHAYAFTDTGAAALQRTLYYRLRWQQPGGNWKHGPIARLVPAQATSVQVYPNPASSWLVVRGQHLAGQTNIRVYAASGQLMYAQQRLGAGQWQHNIATNTWPSGSYYVVVQAAQWQHREVVFIR